MKITIGFLLVLFSTCVVSDTSVGIATANSQNSVSNSDTAWSNVDNIYVCGDSQEAVCALPNSNRDRASEKLSLTTWTFTPPLPSNFELGTGSSLRATDINVEIDGTDRSTGASWQQQGSPDTVTFGSILDTWGLTTVSVPHAMFAHSVQTTTSAAMAALTVSIRAGHSGARDFDLRVDCVQLKLSYHVGAPRAPCRVAFTTRASYNGNLGGTAGADDKCVSAAESGPAHDDVKARVAAGDSFVAFLGATGERDLLQALNLDENDCVRLPGGAVVAFSRADLLDGSLARAVDQTERGQDADNSRVWSNVKSDGTINDGTDCDKWTTNNRNTRGNDGNVDETNGEWVNRGDSRCNSDNGLICVSVPPNTGSTQPTTTTTTSSSSSSTLSTTKITTKQSTPLISTQVNNGGGLTTVFNGGQSSAATTTNAARLSGTNVGPVGTTDQFDTNPNIGATPTTTVDGGALDTTSKDAFATTDSNFLANEDSALFGVFSPPWTFYVMLTIIILCVVLSVAFCINVLVEKRRDNKLGGSTPAEMSSLSYLFDDDDVHNAANAPAYSEINPVQDEMDLDFEIESLDSGDGKY